MCRQLYRQELLEKRTKQKVEISEIDGRLNQQYEEKLYAMLQDMRAQFEDELNRTKSEAGALYEDKVCVCVWGTEINQHFEENWNKGNSKPRPCMKTRHMCV